MLNNIIVPTKLTCNKILNSGEINALGTGSHLTGKGTPTSHIKGCEESRTKKRLMPVI